MLFRQAAIVETETSSAVFDQQKEPAGDGNVLHKVDHLNLIGEIEVKQDRHRESRQQERRKSPAGDHFAL